jgi:hypothetical protein
VAVIGSQHTEKGAFRVIAKPMSPPVTPADAATQRRRDERRLRRAQLALADAYLALNAATDQLRQAKQELAAAAARLAQGEEGA